LVFPDLRTRLSTTARIVITGIVVVDSRYDSKFCHMDSDTCIAPGHTLRVSSVYRSCNQLQTKKNKIKRPFVTVTRERELSMRKYGLPAGLISPGSLPHVLMLKICKK